ncbi:MAG: plasmid stabilization protein [Bacteroidetes bacterium 4484_249]|nr:MAG: plasmid stabilization protein [Bacteroidetes bacterium 4484_249]
MIIKIDKRFEKDTNKVNDKKLLNDVADCIEQVQKSENILKIKKIKRLKTSANFYRIRIGDYRIGISINNKTVEFIRFLHRKDIYKYFP